jgi:hypothetical protein
MLIACISERAKRFDVPADLPVLRDRETLAQVLASFGTKLVREISDRAVIAVFRLAIAEKHTSVSAEDFAKEPHRNRYTILLTRTMHMALHFGQFVLTKPRKSTS